jgi:hypothetical protein
MRCSTRRDPISEEAADADDAKIQHFSSALAGSPRVVTTQIDPTARIASSK